MAGFAAARMPYASAAAWPERVLAFAERSHARAAALLVALALVCFLPGFVSLQPMDRDEPRFAQASRQMLETGDYVDIRFQDEARYKKPIGIHWLQVASVRAAEALGVPGARDAIAVYRLPSLAGALAAVLLAYWAALAFAGRREAFLAAALMGSSLILMVEARLAKTDAVLLACSIAAMGAMARVWLARGAPGQPAGTLAIFWLAVAAGILIKGPMVILFTGLAALALSARERSGRWLLAFRPGLGILLVLLAVSPWFLAIAWKSGGEFYRLAVGDDMLGKVTSGQQKHFAPPGFYLVAFFATFWPGAALAAIAAPFAWRERRDDAVAFLLAWIVPAWLVFEAVPTKLPHYVMPLYPAVAILAVLAVARGFTGPWRWGARLGYGLVLLIPAGLALAIPLAGWRFDGSLPAAALPALALACAVALAAWIAFNRGDVRAAALTGVASAAAMSVAALGLAQPDLAALRLSPRLAALVRSATCGKPEVTTLGYREPSLVFLVGTGLDMVTEPADAARFLAAPGCRVAIVQDRFAAGFGEALARTGQPVTTLGRISGFNINSGRRTEIAVFAASR